MTAKEKMKGEYAFFTGRKYVLRYVCYLPVISEHYYRFFYHQPVPGLNKEEICCLLFLKSMALRNP